MLRCVAIMCRWSYTGYDRNADKKLSYHSNSAWCGRRNSQPKSI